MDESLGYEAFYSGARKAAHKAMEDHGRSDYDGFALHAGVAVEKLAKALLVKLNPIYIVEMRGSAEMLFHLGGHRKCDKLRTIGATEAVARLRTLKALLPSKDLDLLIDIRNGVAHATSGAQAKSLLPVLAQTVEVLISGADEDPRQFWGRWADTARMAIDNKRSQLERDVMVRVRQARHRFEDRFAGLPEGVKEKALHSPPPEAGQMVIGPLTVRNGSSIIFAINSVPCPACTGDASITLTPSNESATSTTMEPDSFKCRMCGLELDTPEEIKVSGANTENAMLVAVHPTSGYSIHFGESQAG
ncbi:hypothetical protein ACIOD1_05540 [Streptomyces sp. NPDC088097]|uniref:hypothetical protein n=1 Tax=Streptomyces sp. NPDC088097 TaxID=3365823 RepID=UPI00382594A6